MTEESRGKRRKQANPRRNQVEAEQVSSLGSEDEDEVGLWSLEPQDCQESLDKTSLTPSEGTEEPGSPAHSARPQSLSPGSRNYWTQVESEAKTEEDPSYMSTDREGDPEPLRMYCKSSDSQDTLEDLPHFLAQLRKASTSASLLGRLNLNGSTAAYYQSRRHDELPPAIWSPGAQHVSPEGADAGRSQQACPFCHRMYQQGASLRDHVKYCQEWEVGQMVCPLCGYTATLRSQMERHLTLHSQMQDKSPIPLDQGVETRKFKCLQCGKAFKYKHHLKEHLRIHSGEKPYECSNCKKRFSHSGSYSSHLSSKKCLSGGGHVGGNTGGTSRAFNGHSQSSYHLSLSTSPSAGGSRSNYDKASVLASQNQDSNTRPLGRISMEPQQLLLHNVRQNTPSYTSVPDLVRLWDPLSELSLTAGILKETPLSPFIHSGTKFEQMLQEMLHRDVRNDEAMDKEDIEERRGVHNGERPEKKVSPERRKSGEADRSIVGVKCRWCLQLFPSVAVLLQHERYLCKMSREAVEVPEGFQQKEHSSTPFFFPKSVLQPETNKSSEVTNGVCGNKSPLQNPSWKSAQSAQQQLLVAIQSPPPRHDALSSRMYWSSQEKGSPSQLIRHSPELSSPRGRRRVPSSGFSSPACLDLTSGPPEISSPQKELDSLWSVQNEPLDLSLPKHLLEQRGRNKTPNGISSKGDRRELGTQQFGRPSLNSHLSLHQYQVFSGTGPPVFPSPLYNGFPIFSQSGTGLSVHDGITASPFSQSANSPGFLSPMPYMMEADVETAWKKIYQERQGLMGDALNRSAVDYFSLIDDGFEGEGAPGRKRLKKTDEGLYACDICDKTFQKSSSLLRHKYEHTGKRPHECKICKKAFKHKHHLIEHSRLHSGEKPYQCDKCGKRFSHSGSYSQHMNHRYAYCSKDQDQDQDQDQEEMPLTLGPGNNPLGSLAEGTPLSADDNQTAQSFLSDSSLDGTLDVLKEEEEEGGDRVHEGNISLSEAADKLGSSAVKESSTVEDGVQNEKNSYNLEKHTDNRESHMYSRDTEDQNEDLNKYELNMEIKELPRIKT